MAPLLPAVELEPVDSDELEEGRARSRAISWTCGGSGADMSLAGEQDLEMEKVEGEKAMSGERYCMLSEEYDELAGGMLRIPLHATGTKE